MSLPQTAAVLGLGIIGSRACQRLRDAGWEVACWNRTPKRLPGEAATPEEAVADAAVISLYLKDAVAVKTTVERLAGLLDENRIVLNHATLDLETTLWLDAFCRERGARFLDAPFTGSRDAAANGMLYYYVGGDETLLEEVRPYLEVTGRDALFCGPVGTATVVKLGTNLISACTVQALAEALAIATRHGVAPERFVHAVSQNGHASALSAMKLPVMVSGDYDTHFSLANMGKDSRYVLELAEQAGLDVPAIAAVSRRMGELCEKGLGDLDFAALAKPYLDPP